MALRARIVLGCAAGLSNKSVAARERVTVQTVGKWRRRFVERGLDGLLEEPRPGAPRTIDHAKVVKAWLARQPGYHLHFTPTSASWLNQVERWFALLTDKQIKRGVHRSIDQLKADIAAFIQAHNDHPKPFIWTKTADAILETIARYCSQTRAVHAAISSMNF